MTFLPSHVDAEYVRRACAGGRCKPPPRARGTSYAVRRLPGGRIAFGSGEPPGLRFGVSPWRSLDGAVGLGAAGPGAVRLPDKLTPLTGAQAAEALAAAYKRIAGRVPSKQILGLLLAQSAQETGEWKSIHNYSFGNAKATSSDRYYQGFRCWEVINGQTVWYDADHPMCQFSAYVSAEDGAEHFVRLLARRPHWWAGLQTGTVGGFVAALSTAPVFFTGDPSVYARRMNQFMAEYATQAMQYAGANKVTVLGGAVGVFALTFGGWYLYNTMTARKRAR